MTKQKKAQHRRPGESFIRRDPLFFRPFPPSFTALTFNVLRIDCSFRSSLARMERAVSRSSCSVPERDTPNGRVLYVARQIEPINSIVLTSE